jgi:hypothetical protein
MKGITPQQRTRNYLTDRGWLVGSVERRKKFPDRKKSPCRVCGHQPMIEISADLWEVFDIVAVEPIGIGMQFPHVIFVQTTSRANHSTRKNKILASMEGKLVLLSGARILLQSWGQEKNSKHWEARDEWITLDDYKQAPQYPSTVAELMEIKRRAKQSDFPAGTTLPLSADLGKESF